jgi:hypothetical protein
MDQPLPLAQALEKFSNPDALSRFNKLEATCRKRGWVVSRFGGSIISIGKKEPGFERLIAALDAAKEAIVAPFLDGLRAGALIAVGTPYPATLDSAEIRIPAAWWHFLNPLFAAYGSPAEGGGLRFVGVRVAPAETSRDASNTPFNDAPIAPKALTGRRRAVPKPDDKVGIQIRKVIAAAMLMWPAISGNCPSPSVMATELKKSRPTNGCPDMERVTLKKILEGSYLPMVARGIKSPYRR